ncbi:glycine-rich RNA-binding protein 3, mitochondrial-like [Durio zibethinus]|uniref:Glycine-rich RNA-binding protein 3, mitochondrial-like n=1 Tax=Durio zibethinus TaxID=66656 RepID=A0A6P6AWL2_DURZI|nr:glycine-rich RNA-binding protein 3, mitochondrial-like [Durio zibethinus]
MVNLLKCEKHSPINSSHVEKFQRKYLDSGRRTIYINPRGFYSEKETRKQTRESLCLSPINKRVVSMAFLSKVGNILRQTTSMQIDAQLSASRPGLFQVFRCMSTSPSSKLFVGGISYQTDDQSLKEAFSKYGEVIEARVILDRETGRSRGFGFVTYTSTEDASSAIQALDGQPLLGRQVRVNYAAERPPRNFGGGGAGYGAPGGGFNSSYGGGSYGSSGYGGGNYGGGGYDRNADSFSGNYGGNVGYGNSGGSGNYGGQGNYGGDNYGTGGVGYGSKFGQSGANNYDSGSFNVAGDGGGTDSFSTGGSGGYEGDNVGFGSGDQLGSAEDGSKDEAGAFDQNDPLNEEDDTGDFAKRA